MDVNRTVSVPDLKVGLIAGSGQFPLLFAHAALQQGIRVIAVGFEGETDPSLSRYVCELHMLKLGQLGKLIRVFQTAGVRHAVMAGAINKTRLYTRIRPDWRAVKFLNRLRNKKDDSILRALAEELESEGIRIEASTILLPSLLAPEGTLTRRKPNRQEQQDLEFGWQIAKAIGVLDIGQCLVVKNQAVVAIEGIDGTDATILRGGLLCREGAVVIKTSKPNQDLRFDVPAVGAGTIEAMKRVGARVLVVEADKTLIFDRERMIDEADAAGITIVVRSGSDPTAAIPGEGSEGAIARFTPAGQTGSRIAEILPVPPALTRRPGPHALRVAVIGVGYLGRFHARKYARLADADLVAVADIDRSRGEGIAGECQTQFMVDYRDLLGRVDAVSVVVPTPAHFSVAREFLDAGAHVLLEKPMTRTLEEADRLIDLAREKGRILQIGHLERFNSAFQAIHPRLNRPMFLEAHRLAPFNERGTEVDVILDLMIHDIDIALHIMGSPLKKIRVAGASVLTALPDIANVRMEFDSGATANLTASRISVKSLRKHRIFQENCYFVADYAERRAYAVYREKEPDEAGYPQISMEEIELDERDALEEEIIAFLHAVKTGGKPAVDGVEGRRALAVALDISRQIEEQVRNRNGTIPGEVFPNLSECG